MNFDADFAGRVVLGWAEDTTHMNLISPQDLFQLVAEDGALKLSDVAEVGKRARGNAEEQLDRPVVGDWDGDGKDDVGIFGRQWQRDPQRIKRDLGLSDPANKRRRQAMRAGDYDASPAVTELGMNWTPIEDSVVDGAKSAIEAGWR